MDDKLLIRLFCQLAIGMPVDVTYTVPIEENKIRFVSIENSPRRLKIDLHSHTRCSDGYLTPEELVLRAQTMQVDVLAITDHDTVDGLEHARQAIAKHNTSLTLINGVEVSTRWHGFDIHIVGLNIDPEAATLKAFLREQTQIRDERAAKIGEKLVKCGFDGAYESARRRAGEGQLTRAHFARALVEEFGVGSMDKAFKLYLGKGKRAAVTPLWPSPQTAIEQIQLAGGQAVLAHPLHYDLSTKWLRRLIAEFADANGDAVEIVFPGMSEQKRQVLLEIVAQHGLRGSAGSDFHHPGRWTELGRCAMIETTLLPVWHDWANLPQSA